MAAETVNVVLAVANITADPAPAVSMVSYFCDTTGGGFDVTVPNVADVTDGIQIRVTLSVGVSTVVVTTVGGTDLIGTATSQAITQAGTGITIQANAGSGKWEIVQDSRGMGQNRGNTLYVDAVFGNDGTALPDRADLPYLTLNAAKAAWTAGDEIRVRPGTYTERLMFGPCNWHFELGAICDYSGTVQGSAYGDNLVEPATGRITGYGVFRHSGNPDNTDWPSPIEGAMNAAVGWTHIDTDVYFECLDVLGDQQSSLYAGGFMIDTGRIRFNIKRLLWSSIYDALLTTPEADGYAVIDGHIETIETGPSADQAIEAVSQISGLLTVGRIIHGNTNTISLNLNTGNLIVECPSIVGGGVWVIDGRLVGCTMTMQDTSDNPNFETCYVGNVGVLDGCTINQTKAGIPAMRIDFGTPRIVNCQINAGAGATESIISPSPITLTAHGSTMFAPVGSDVTVEGDLFYDQGGPADDQVPTANADGTWSWADPGGGAGDVTGPASAVDDNIALFDGTTGKLIKDAGINLSEIIEEDPGAGVGMIESGVGVSPIILKNIKDGQGTQVVNNTGSVQTDIHFSAIDKYFYSDVSGNPLEGTITTAGRNLIDDATVADQRTTLGLNPTAKGDIISASAASTPATLPVGLENQVLRSRAAAASGLEWGNAELRILIQPQANTLTNQPNTPEFLGAANPGIYTTKVDLTLYRQAMILVHVFAASASLNNPRVMLRYSTTYSLSVGSYVDIGTSEVSASFSSVGVIESAWIDLAAGAKANVYIAAVTNGGNGVADPTIVMTTAIFR